MFQHSQTFIGTTAVALAAIVTVACSDGAPRQAPPQAQAPRAPVERAVPPVVPTAGIVSAPAEPAREVSSRFEDGEAAYHARNYTDAAQIFSRYIERHPRNAWGHYMLGLSWWKAGDHARAEAALEEALRRDPRHVKSYVNLARVRLDVDKAAEALDALEQAAGVAGGSTEVQRLLGRTYRALGRTDEAIEAYERAIEFDPRDSWAMNNLGLIFLEARRIDAALPLLARAVELRRDEPVFQNNLGMALEHAGQFRAAADAYGLALEADPDFTKARRNLARVEQVKTPAPPQADRDAAARAAEVAATSREAIESRP